ncbi:MAG: hypothetical protein QOG23_4623 [Blastocatellia bacterium]|jgi:hypothetical protein|nr:hypothetical protein [Blastocatellia bacterium]
MLLNVLSNFVAVLLGALITWFFSRRYYTKATVDLVNEASKLRHLNTIMLNAMEDAGLVKLNRNEKGEIVGRIIEASVVFQGSTTMTGNLEVNQSQKV